MFLTDPASRRMTHTALPRALPSALPPPRRSAPSPNLLYLCLNLLKHICELTGSCLITPRQFLRVQLTTMEVSRLPIRHVLSVSSQSLCASPCLSWVMCTSSPGRAPCPLDSWRADIMASGVNTRKKQSAGRAGEPVCFPVGFWITEQPKSVKKNKSKKC